MLNSKFVYVVAMKYLLVVLVTIYMAIMISGYPYYPYVRKYLDTKYAGSVGS
jgi:hypothetical protein